MASVKELRDSISKGRQALAEAVEAAAGRWEAGGDASPKALTEGALRAEVERAGKAAAILGGNPVAAQEWSIDTAQAASEALGKLGPEVDKRFSWAEDRDLGKGRDGVTLEQLMQQHAADLTERASRIGSA
ncbi:MAG: hypothetical protein R3C39_12540 [Dehalococcoidia bacterium]